MSGELGCGKTKFTEGVLKYFGLENEISSPTFTIVNEYHKDSVTIYHFDVYRLSDVEEFYAIGGEEYFSNGICIIEWGEIIKEALPKDYLKSRELTRTIQKSTSLPRALARNLRTPCQSSTALT